MGGFTATLPQAPTEKEAVTDSEMI